MKKLLTVIIALIFVIILFHPGRHAKYYNYIKVLNIINELVPHRILYNLKSCSLDFYERLLSTHAEINSGDLHTINNFTLPLNGGEYIPKDCQPIFKTAIVVPYRNRTEQLQAFLNYMHPFLQFQKIHYKIFIVDQRDNKPFNRAKMLNIGAKVASKMDFPCLILHDVDLFPLSRRNIYACSKLPRHMSSAVDTLRFNLPYLNIVGGVFAIQTKQFESVNGMSNEFYGWGGEDDDFYQRLRAFELSLCRFAPEISEYSMLFHKKEKASKERWKKLQNILDRQPQDGLNTLPNYYNIDYKPLYTHIIID